MDARVFLTRLIVLWFLFSHSLKAAGKLDYGGVIQRSV